MIIFLDIVPPVTAPAAPQPYIDFFKTQGPLAVFFVLIVLLVWKVVIPAWKSSQEKTEQRQKQADEFLLKQIQDSKEQVLRSEGRADHIADKFNESLKALLESNERQLDQFDTHVNELAKLRESIDKLRKP